MVGVGSRGVTGWGVITMRVCMPRGGRKRQQLVKQIHQNGIRDKRIYSPERSDSSKNDGGKYYIIYVLNNLQPQRVVCKRRTNIPKVQAIKQRGCCGAGRRDRVQDFDPDYVSFPAASLLRRPQKLVASSRLSVSRQFVVMQGPPLPPPAPPAPHQPPLG